MCDDAEIMLAAVANDGGVLLRVAGALHEQVPPRRRQAAGRAAARGYRLWGAGVVRIYDDNEHDAFSADGGGAGVGGDNHRGRGVVC